MVDASSFVLDAEDRLARRTYEEEEGRITGGPVEEGMEDGFEEDEDDDNEEEDIDGKVDPPPLVLLLPLPLPLLAPMFLPC